MRNTSLEKLLQTDSAALRERAKDVELLAPEELVHEEAVAKAFEQWSVQEAETNVWSRFVYSLREHLAFSVGAYTALAVCVLLVVFVPSTFQNDTWRSKGQPLLRKARHITLQPGVWDPHRKIVRRVGDGDVVSASHRLVFRFYVHHISGYIYLLLRKSGVDRELLLPMESGKPKRWSVGVHDVVENKTALYYPLKGFQGSLSLLLVKSSVILSKMQVQTLKKTRHPKSLLKKWQAQKVGSFYHDRVTLASQAR